MTADHVTLDSAGWAAPHSAPRRWGAGRTAAAVAIAVVIGGLGGAAVYAATGHTEHFAMGRFDGPGFDPAGSGGAHSAQGWAGQTAGPALHGQMVVPDGDGRFTTVVIQTGTLTAVTPTSATVRSVDGFSQTYSVPAGLQVPAVDEPVTVRAVRDAPGDGPGPAAAPRLTQILDTGTGAPDRP